MELPAGKMLDIQSPMVSDLHFSLEMRRDLNSGTATRSASLARLDFPTHPVHSERPDSEDERLAIPRVTGNSSPPDRECGHQRDNHSNPFLGVRR